MQHPGARELELRTQRHVLVCATGKLSFEKTGDVVEAGWLLRVALDEKIGSSLSGIHGQCRKRNAARHGEYDCDHPPSDGQASRHLHCFPHRSALPHFDALMRW